MGRTVRVNITESYTTYVYREHLEINVEDYPELEGKSDEEIAEYIQNNASDMKAPEDYDYADNLYDACMEMDIANEKVNNEEYEIDVEI
jgi:hypothetical protein